MRHLVNGSISSVEALTARPVSRFFAKLVGIDTAMLADVGRREAAKRLR